jgi:hypothetical protein
MAGYDDTISQMKQSQAQTDSNPYDDTINQLKDQAQQAQARAAIAVSTAATENPDTAAQNIALAKRYKVTPDIVATFPQEFRDRMTLESARQNLANAPKLQAHINDTPGAAGALHPDVSAMSQLEQTASQPSLADRTDNGVLHGLLNFSGWLTKTGGTITDSAANAMHSTAAATNLTLGALPLMADYAGQGMGLTKDAPMSDWWFKNMVAPEYAGVDATEMPKDAGFDQKLIGSITKLGVMLGGIALSGGSSAEAQTATQSAGPLSTLGQATVHALKSMWLPATTDAVNTGHKVYEATGDGAAALKAAEAQYVATTGMGLVPLSAQGGLGLRLATGALSGVTSGEASRRLMNAASPDSMQTPFSWEDSFLSGVTGSLMGGLMGPGKDTSPTGQMIRKTYTDAAEREQASNDMVHLTTLGQLASSIKYRESDPEGFKKFAQAVTEDGNLPNVYVNAETLAKTMQKAGVTLEQLRANMPQVADDLAEATKVGATTNDVRIPTSDYLTHIAGTPVGDELLQHFKRDPDGKTFAQVKEEYQGQADKMKETATALVKDKEERDAFRQSQQAVQDKIHSQLDELGRQPTDVNRITATIQAAIISRVAAAEKITPEEAWAKHGNAIVGDRTAGGLDQGAPGGITVTGYHYSKAERSMLTTGLFGTGLQGSARDEILNHPDKRLRKRLSFYVDKGTGINPEAGVGGIAHKAVLTNMYDANRDPLRLRKGSARDFESRVLDHGYSGYVDRMDGTQSGHAILLGDRTITPEKLGSQTKMRGEVVPAAAQRASLGRDKIVDALQADKTLPVGFMPLASWSKLLEKVNPEAHAAMAEAGVFDGTGSAYKSDLIKSFEAKTDAPDYAGAFAQTLPGRWPTAAKANPSLNDVMLPDLATLKEDPKQYERAVDAVRAEPGMRTKSRTTDKMAEEMIHRMVDNLLWLHDQVPQNIRDRSKLWYDGAQKIATRWSEKWGKSRSQTAGMLAVLSPQKDWFMNTTMAERVGDILSGQMHHAWDDKMNASAFKFLSKDVAGAEDRAGEAKNLAAYAKVKGKTLAEVVATGDKRAVGIWVRAYDEAYHGASHAIISPEGNFDANKLTAKGEEARRAWGDFSAIGKAASIFIDGSPGNINEQIGGEHKVRNFYNNIYNASDNRFTTIDTHAVAAALLRPLAGADNFGATGGTNQTGVSGSYPLYYEAYKRAAEARGVLPREMQSITWEAVRGLYTEGFKSKENKAAIDALWKQVDSGKLTVDEARKQLLEKAGGIEHPDWWTGGEPKDNEILRDKTYDQERGEFKGTKIAFEVAPDPRDTQTKAAWDALPADTRAKVSHDIAWNIAAKALNHFKVGTSEMKGELHMQMGGWMADTNPSLSLWMGPNTSAPKVLELANLLGYALNQEGMMVTSPKKMKGGEEMGVVVIHGVDVAGAKSLYNELRENVRSDSGEDLINGHSTGGGDMAILVPKEQALDISSKIADYLGDRHDVGHSEIHTAWPSKGENDYGFHRENTTKQGSPLQQTADRLRAEAAEQLQRALTGQERGDPGDAGFGQPSTDAGTAGRAELNQSDLFPGEFADKTTTVNTGIKVSSKGDTLQGGNVNSDGQQITATKQGLQKFWDWFGQSEAVDEKGNPLVLYHSTNADTDVLKDGQKTTNNYGLLGDVGLSRSGIFLTPERDFSQEYLRSGGGQNVMQLYARLEKPLDLREGMTPEVENELCDAGISRRWLFDYRQHDWEMFDNDDNDENYFVDTLKQLGYDGAIFHEDGQDGKSHETYVVFDGAQLKSATGNKGTFDGSDSSVLNQPTGWDSVESGLSPDWQKPSVGARGTFNPSSNTIALLKDANLSTYLHETGHWALDMYSKIAASENAPPEIKADMDKILKWFGVESLEKWNSMSLDEQRPHHEQFARGFESYLMEGKAPSQELSGPFARVRAWMTDIYRSLKSLNVELTSEVRGVFDRMLASEDAINEAQSARVFEPLFTEKPAGMSADEWSNYVNQGQEATTEAISQMQTRSLRDMKWLSNAKSKAMKALQRDAKAARDDVQSKVEKEVGDMPVYRMEDWVKENNQSSDADKQALKEWNERRDSQREKAAEAVKAEYLAKPEAAELKGLQKAQYVSRARREMANEVDRRVLDWEKQNKKPSLVKPDIDTELLAERFGFGSGEEAMRALADAPPRKEVIEGMVDRRMLEEHGELSSPDAIEQAANEAVHNAARAKFMATGLKILAKSPISARALLNGAREAAEGAIAIKRVGDLNPKQYLAAETRANREAIKLAPTDPQGAVQAQRAALLNNQLVKAAYDAQDLVRKALAYAKSFDRISKRLKIEPEERDMIDALLARFDFRANPTHTFTGEVLDPKAHKQQLQLTQWAESQKALGYTPVMNPDMMNESVRMHYKDMSVEQLRGLMDTIRSIEKIGRERQTVTVDGQRMDVQAAVEPMVAKMVERGEKFTDAELVDRPRYGVDPLWRVTLDRLQSIIRAGVSEFMRPDYKANKYDLHELMGPFQKAVSERLLKAAYDNGDFMDQVAQIKRNRREQFGLDREWQGTLDTVVANHNLMDNSLDVPAKRRLTRGDLIGIAMHVGNESNFDKLVRGMKWDPQDVWNTLHENMTEKDWRAAQSLGEMAGAKWTDVAAMNRRLGNDNPDKIEPRAFPTKFGDMPGWYSPISYDPIRSRLGRKKADAAAVNPADGLFSSNYYRADTTTNGSLNARASGYYDFIDLNWRPIEKRISDTMRDLAYREALIDVHKIYTNGDFRRQFNRTYGPEEYKHLGDWLGRLVNSEVGDEKQSKLTAIAATARRALVANGVAFRLSTMFKHGGSAAFKSTGYFAGGGEKYFAARIAQMATNHSTQVVEALAKFPEIRQRARQQDRDFAQTVGSIFEPESLHGKAERFGHAGVSAMDFFTAVPTAHAAYDWAITEGIPKRLGGTGQPMSEADAIKFASKVVREAHGSTNEASQSLLINNKSELVKGLTTLHGFMNNAFGQNADSLDKLLHGNGLGKPEILARTMMAQVVPAMMAGWVTFGGPNENESYLGWAFHHLGGEFAGMLPMVREAWSAGVEGYSSAGLPPWIRAITDTVKVARDVAREVKGEETTNAIKHAGNAGGILLPGLGQAGSTTQFLYDELTGKQQAETVGEWVRGVMSGKAKH